MSLKNEIERSGHEMTSPYKYDQAVEEDQAPPYPSEKYYDAKLWQFVVSSGKPGALIWNVA